MGALKAAAILLAAMVLASFCRPVPAADLEKVETIGADCPGCVAVDRVLIAKKVNTVRACKVSAKSISPYYPRCTYSDGSKDAGQKVINGKCGFARKVYVITWMEGKK